MEGLFISEVTCNVFCSLIKGSNQAETQLFKFHKEQIPCNPVDGFLDTYTNCQNLFKDMPKSVWFAQP